MMKTITKQANRKTLLLCVAVAALLALALFTAAFAGGGTPNKAYADTPVQSLMQLHKVQLPDGVELDEENGNFTFTESRNQARETVVSVPTVLDTLTDDKIYLADGTSEAIDAVTFVYEATMASICKETYKVPYLIFYRFKKDDGSTTEASCQIYGKERGADVGFLFYGDAQTEFWNWGVLNAGDTYNVRLELTGNVARVWLNEHEIQVGAVTLPEGGTPILSVCSMPDIAHTIQNVKFYVKDKTIADYVNELDASDIVAELDEGDELSGTLSATTVNGQEEIELTDGRVQISGFDKNEPGEQEVTFSVTTHNQTVSVTKKITVNTTKEIDHYSVSLKNSTLECGHAFDKSNVVITAHYEDESTGNQGFEEDEITVSGFDPYKLGTQTITVAYGGTDYPVDLTVSTLGNLALWQNAEIPDGVTLGENGKFTFSAERTVELPTVLDRLADDKIYFADGTDVSVSEATLVFEATLDAVCVEGWKVPFVEFYRYTKDDGTTGGANCQVRSAAAYVEATEMREFANRGAYSNDTYVLRVELTGNSVSIFINDTEALKNYTLPQGGAPCFRLHAMPDIEASFQNVKVYVKDKTVADYVSGIELSDVPAEVNEGEELTGNIAATYFSGNMQTLALTDSNVQVSGFDKDQPGDQEVTFSVITHNQTVSVTKTVKVKTTKTFDHYSVSLKNSALECGQPFDKSNVVITEHYVEGGSGNQAFEEDEIEVTGFDPNKLGTQTVHITYKETDYTVEVTVSTFGNLALLQDAELPNGVTLDENGKITFTQEKKVAVPSVLDGLTGGVLYLADGTDVSVSEATLVFEATLDAVCVEGWKIPFVEFYRYTKDDGTLGYANCQVRSAAAYVEAAEMREFANRGAYNNDTYVLRIELTGNSVSIFINDTEALKNYALPQGGTPCFRLCAMPDIEASFQNVKVYVKDQTIANYAYKMELRNVPAELNEGEELTGNIAVTYLNGSTQTLAFSADNVQVSGFDKDQPGDQEVTFSVITHNQTVSVTKTVKVKTTKTFDHYSVSLKNSVLECGQAFDKSNVVITEHYVEGGSGNRAFEEDEITVSGFDPYKIGTQTVHITYDDTDFTVDVTVQDTVSNRIDVSQSANAVTGLKSENGNLTFTNSDGNITITNHTAFTTDTKIGIATLIEGKEYFKKYTEGGEFTDDKGAYDWVRLSDLTVVFAYDVIATDCEAATTGNPSYTPHVFFGDVAYRIQVEDNGPFVWEPTGFVKYADNLSYKIGMGISVEISSSQIKFYYKNNGWKELCVLENTYQNYTQLALEFYNRFAWTYEFTNLKLCFTDADVDVTSGLTEAQYTSQVLGFTSITVTSNKNLYYVGDALDLSVYGYGANDTEGILLDADLYTVDGDASAEGTKTLTVALVDKPEVTAQITITVAKFKNFAVAGGAGLPEGVTAEGGKLTFTQEKQVTVPTILDSLTDSVLYLADGVTSVTLAEVTLVYEATLSATCVEGWKIPYVEFYKYTDADGTERFMGLHVRTARAYLMSGEPLYEFMQSTAYAADTYTVRLELTGNVVRVFINGNVVLEEGVLPEGGTPILRLCAYGDITCMFENVKFYVKDRDLYNYVTDVEVTPATGLNVGDDFAATVVAHYADGSQATLASNGYIVSGFDKTSGEKQNVTVKVVTENVECSKTVAVTLADSVTGIEVKTNPAKTSYKVGDVFDPEGGVISIVYASGRKTDVDMDDVSVTIGEYSFATEGEKTITIGYDGMTTTVTVTVTKKTEGDTPVNPPVENPPEENPEDSGCGCGCNSSLGATSVIGGLFCLVAALVLGKRRKNQNN